MANNKTRPIPELSEDDIRRFWSSVDQSGDPDACWPWMAGCFKPSGYGRFNLPIGKRYEGFYANRIALFLTSGKDPGPLMACHSCDDRYPVGDISYRKCCNGDHLFPGTNQENTADRELKGRGASGDRNGSRIHPERLARGDLSPSRLYPERLKRGVDNHATKLTECDIRKIRERYSGGESQQSIANHFAVAQTAVSAIIRRQTWKHVK